MYNKISKQSSINCSNKIELILGQYPITSTNAFYIQNIKFFIRERKKPTPKKPTYFLSALIGADFHYISSLYPESELTYKMDYKNHKYIITLSDDNISIEGA